MRRPTRDEVTVFPSANAFRTWLQRHHDTVAELWVGYYRKDAAGTSITYPEAVEQALCFGWIDGLTYRVDDEVHTNRFTPRRKGSYWSAVNVRKAEALLAAGRMTDAGLRAFEGRSASEAARYSYENRPSDLPRAMLTKLRANRNAMRFWQAQPPGYRRTAAFWVTSAKQEATRERRLELLIADSAAGRRVKALTPPGSKSNSRRKAT